MATQVQFRGGTTAQNNAFTGASKEITVDTDKDVVVVHDGSTAGGHPLMAEDGSNSALALGSAGTPALKFTDTNTGIYSPGADQIALSTGGAGRLFIDTSGRVGIGEAVPANYDFDGPVKLGVANTSGSSTLSVISGSTSVGQIAFADGTSGSARYAGLLKYNHADNSLEIRTDTTEALRIDSAGNIGIGNSAPSAKLHIEGTSDQLKLTYPSVVSYIHEAHSNGDYSIAKDSSERLRISSGGVLSMGDPITNGGWRVFVADEGSANQRGRMTFRSKNGTVAAQEVIQAYLGSTENFRLRADGGGFFGGSLGVGTSSARGTLHLHTSGATRFDLTNTATGTASGDGSTISIDGSTGALNIIQREAQPINFSTSNSQAATIDASGRLLVGQTTQSNSSLFTIKGNTSNSAGASEITLQRGEAATAITSGESLGHLYFTDNSSNKFAEIAGFADSAAGAGDYPGRLEFRTTADSSSTPTTRMTVKNNGTINFANVQTFADDAAAGSGGLVSGDVYKTSAGDLKIKA